MGILRVTVLPVQTPYHAVPYMRLSQGIVITHLQNLHTILDTSKGLSSATRKAYLGHPEDAYREQAVLSA